MLKLMRMMYGEYLRPLLYAAVKNTETDYDDELLKLADLIFGGSSSKE